MLKTNNVCKGSIYALRSPLQMYCRKCRKSMGISYLISGEDDVSVLTGITMKCRTNKCHRIISFDQMTEGELKTLADKDGKIYI